MEYLNIIKVITYLHKYQWNTWYERTDLLVNDFVYKLLTDRYITLFEHKFVRNFIHIQDVISII